MRSLNIPEKNMSNGLWYPHGIIPQKRDLSQGRVLEGRGELGGLGPRVTKGEPKKKKKKERERGVEKEGKKGKERKKKINRHDE